MNSRREYVLGAALCAVLLTLAVLQYNWIGQVGVAEQVVLQRDLRSSVNRFAEEFDGELQRMMQFLVGAANLQTRLETWRETTRYPGVVIEVWAADAPDLPPYLKTLAARTGAAAAGMPGPIVLEDAGIPAIAFPAQRPPPGEPPTRFTLALLNREYIRDTWIPALVEQTFSRDMRVEVNARGETIYRRGDEAIPLEDGNWTTLFEMRFAGRGGKGRGAGGPFPKEKGKGDFNFDFEKGRKGDKGPRPTGWTVRAAFPSGTIAETVAGVRTRNLAVSFGMLLLMGVSVAMLLFSSRRARELATRQMEFVAGVTHELRTPLAVISSASENLADGVASSPEQTRRYGGVIRDQSKRLAGMIEQILRFAGLSSGQMELRKQGVDVSAIVEQATADSQPDLAASGTVFTREISPDLPPLLGDPTSLVHALRNLIGNAIKHGEGAPVRLRAKVERGAIVITVEDDGPGIDPSDLPHLFEPFYRGRRATSEQIQGAGLGLSLVKKIAEAHGGRVEVVSKPGAGASFTLHLPASTGLATAGEDEAKASGSEPEGKFEGAES